MRFPHVTTGWFLALLLLLAPSRGEASIVAREAERLLGEIGARSGSILAAAPVIELATLRPWALPDDWRGWMLRAAALAEDPDVHAIATYELLRLELGLGRDDVAERIERDMAFLDRWWVIGPFPNDGRSGLAEAWPPEQRGFRPGEAVAGKVMDVTWAKIDRASESGFVELSSFVAPDHGSVAYAWTEFELDASFDGHLSLAVDGAYRVWVNGRPAAEQPDHLGGGVLRDRLPLRLPRGRHVLAIKVAGESHPLGFHARLVDGRGRATTVRFRDRPTVGNAPRTADAWPTVTTLADRVESVLGEDAPAADLAAGAFILHRMMNASPHDPWQPLAARALAGGGSPHDRLRAAQTMAESWRQLEILESAWQETTDPLIGLSLRALLLEKPGHEALERAREVVRGVGRWAPDPVVVWMRAATLRYEGFPREALAQLDGLPAAQQSIPAILTLRHGLLGDLSQRHAQGQVDEALLAIEGLSTARAVSVASFLTATGRTDAVDPMFEALQRRRPHEIGVLRAWADNLVARGQIDRALALLDRAAQQRPGDASLFERRGRILLEAGRREEAVAAFEEALKRQPQNAGLRELVAALAVDVDRFWEAWRIPVGDIVAMREAMPPRDEETWSWVVDQKLVHVYRNGLSRTWVQQAVVPWTREGADQVRSNGITYAPDSETVEILGVQIVRPDGSIREVWETSDSAPWDGPAAIYYDVRTRALYFPGLEAGDLVVWEYVVSDVSSRNMFDDYFGDFWFVQDHQPKALARWGVLHPADRPLFTNAADTRLGTWSEEEVGDDRLLRYEARSVPRVRRESSSPGRSDLFEYISVSTYRDWDTMANWYWNLIRDQLVTNAAMKETVAELVSGVEDRRERVARIHNWVVRNTRYVGLEFGIHGYKPYRTTECFNRRFGDCKDTASLMKVMMAEAGVEARIVLVRTSDLGGISAEPASLSVFNHAILWVPEFDLFLDGTAGFNGTSELPDMDQGAMIVVIEDGRGGRFGQIPWDDAGKTRSITEVSVDLRGDEASGTGVTRLTGQYAPGTRQTYEAAEQRLERFQRGYAGRIPGVRVTDVAFSPLDRIEEPVEVRWSFEGGALVQPQGDVTLVHPFGSESTWVQSLAGASRREHVLAQPFRYEVEDRWTFVVPDVWTLETVPRSAESSGAFGSWSVRFRWVDGRLESERRFRLDVVRVAPADYGAFRSFVAEFDAASRQVARFRTGDASRQEAP